MLFEDPEDYGGLPNVDDLEVAAAAAAATMEAMQELAADSSEEEDSSEVWFTCICINTGAESAPESFHA